MALPPLTTVSLVLGLAVGLGPMTSETAAVAPGGWRWPLAGTPVVARPFQAPPGPWAAGHRGVDLAAPPQATVLAAGPGVVSFAGWVAGVGVVSVTHQGGLRTTYEPVAPSVLAGMAVAAGDPIGRLLPGHGSCGPGRWCLHWGLLRGSVYLDPLTLLRRGPVRLLPLPPAAGAVDRGPTTAVPADPAELALAAQRPTPAKPSTTLVADGRPSRERLVAGGALLGALAGWVAVRTRRPPKRPPRLSRAGRRAWP
jgi:murein DD-endopeptidase MepM/ murein hydrolase activator NlpD